MASVSDRWHSRQRAERRAGDCDLHAVFADDRLTVRAADFEPRHDAGWLDYDVTSIRPANMQGVRCQVYDFHFFPSSINRLADAAVSCESSNAATLARSSASSLWSTTTVRGMGLPTPRAIANVVIGDLDSTADRGIG